MYNEREVLGGRELEKEKTHMDMWMKGNVVK